MAEIISHFPDGKEFTYFKERHERVLAALDEIVAGLTALLTLIEQKEASAANNTLYLLVGAAVTEFEEVMVLALNGYGSGATKLLRALYERTVTVQYLMRRPEKVGQFIDYTSVHWYKLLKEADENGVGENLSMERRAEIEANFAKVKEDFKYVICKNCKKSELQASWTKKPVPAQAREVGEGLGTLCFHGYLMPTFFLHTTFWGISQQLKEHKDGRLELHNRENERRHAERAIFIACNLVAHMAINANNYYQLDATKSVNEIVDAINVVGDELMIEQSDLKPKPG